MKRVMEIHKGYSERGQVGVGMQWRGAGVTGRFWFVVGRFMPQAHRHYRLSTYSQCEEKKITRPHLRYLTSGPKKGKGGGLISIAKCSRKSTFPNEVLEMEENMTYTIL